jgi:8-oxo-dGTP diphosphatase
LTLAELGVACTRSVGNLVDYGYRLAYRVAYPLSQLMLPFHNQNGVCVAVWVDGRLLVVRHSYKPGLSIPGGGVKSREDIRLSAKRELWEEVGIDVEVNALDLIHTHHFTRHRGTNYFFEVRLAVEPIVSIDRREILCAEFLTPSEIKLSGCDRYFARYLDAQHLVTAPVPATPQSCRSGHA